MLINGYQTKVVGICHFAGLQTRRILNAPISMDFKHSIGTVGAEWINLRGENRMLRDNVRVSRVPVPEQRIDRYFIGVELPITTRVMRRLILDVSDAIVIDKYADRMINAQLNDIADVAAKEARIPVFANLMQQYDKCWLGYPNRYGGRSPLSDVSA